MILPAPTFIFSVKVICGRVAGETDESPLAGSNALMARAVVSPPLPAARILSTAKLGLEPAPLIWRFTQRSWTRAWLLHSGGRVTAILARRCGVVRPEPL